MKKTFLFFLFFIVTVDASLYAAGCDSTVTRSCTSSSTSSGSLNQSMEVRIYGCDGRLKKITEFSNGFGEIGCGVFDWYTIVSETDYSYDTLAFTDTVVYQGYFNGSPDIAHRDIITYDTAGRVIEKVMQYDNSGTWVNQSRNLFSYNSISQPLIKHSLSWDGSTWENQKKEEYNYSLSHQILQYNILQDPAYDTTYKFLYFYDIQDSLQETDTYQSFVTGTATELTSIELYVYGTGNRRSGYKYYKVDTSGTAIQKRCTYVYDSLQHAVYEYQFACPDTFCTDTMGYNVQAFSLDSLTYNDYDYDKISFLHNHSNDTGYFRASRFTLVKDSAGNILEQHSGYSNLDPPIYSHYEGYVYTYDADGRITTSCFDKSGSHEYDLNESCNYNYQTGDSAGFYIRIYTLENSHCPEEPVPGFILISGGTPPYTLSWNLPLEISDSTSTTFNFINDVTKLFQVQAVDSSGLTSSDTVTIIRKSFSVSMIDSMPLCEGDTLNLNFNVVADSSEVSNMIFFWRLDGTGQYNLLQDSSFIPPETGIYFITTNNIQICPDGQLNSDSVDVLLIPPPVVSIGSDTTLCISQDILLDAGAGFASYQWQDGSAMQTFLAASAIPDTVLYAVEVSDTTGCINADTCQIIFEVCSGVDETEDLNVLIFPNPAHAFITLQAQPEYDAAEVQVFNILGDCILKQKLISSSAMIDCSNFSKGMYAVKIMSFGKQAVRRIFVQ